MYQLYFNGLPIYDPHGQDLGLVILDPRCRLAVGEPGEMTFQITNDHPNASELTKLTGVLELRASGVPIFKGRLIKDTRVFDLTREIEAEGLLACLNDSVIPPFNFPEDFEEDAAYQAAAESGNVVQFFLDWILAEHNSQVAPDQQIILGDVTVADPNNYISRASSEYLTAMEVVRKKLEDLMGGYLLADYSGDTTVLHYYDDLPLTNMQTVVYGENLLDLVTETDATKVYTAIHPIGKDGLTIEELGDGELAPGFVKQGAIIYSQEAEDQYNGLRIVRKVEWSDVTLARNLQTKALAQLSTDGVMLAQTITAKAADLGGTDDIQRFRVGRYVELQSSPHGFSATYPLMELEPNILDPGDTTITMGATVKTASDLANGNNSANQEKNDQQQIELNKQDQAIKDLAETTETKITQAIQTAESIIFSALESYVKTSDYEEYKKTVSSELEILADRISLNFEQTTEQIEDVNGDLQKTVEKLQKHFDFGIDGLGIRAGENAMTLTLDNDLVIFKKNGQPFGWWDGVDFHTGNIVIDVTERAQFGSFAFVPRSNGSLDFLKVSGMSTAKTLLTISATYEGGPVPVGTSLAELTGITVTAIYSDNSTEVVEGYKMSGEIKEGENLIAITYGDKTTSITVVGEVIAGGDIELGSKSSALVVAWSASSTATYYDISYADSVEVIDDAISLVSPKTVRFYRAEFSDQNDYTAILGKYVYCGSYYYINSDSTYEHSTAVSAYIAESVTYYSTHKLAVVTD